VPLFLVLGCGLFGCAILGVVGRCLLQSFRDELSHFQSMGELFFFRYRQARHDEHPALFWGNSELVLLIDLDDKQCVLA